ncbi:uncharacterized protein LOC126076514 [Elephas maximus indicus]|uniref:uncharacterized protein LOC126076514 n=1 Tax=Elephas maximus indicus TaxID=99487 RepID=UPI00211724D7|nr:uncharacterized protein LOC126076514 [Elephas maximus indicus]
MAPRLERYSPRSNISHFLPGISPSCALHRSRELSGRGPHEQLGPPPGSIQGNALTPRPFSPRSQRDVSPAGTVLSPLQDPSLPGISPSGALHRWGELGGRGPHEQLGLPPGVYSGECAHTPPALAKIPAGRLPGWDAALPAPRPVTSSRGFLPLVRRTALANWVGVALTDGWALPQGLFRGMHSHPACSRQDPSGTAPRLGCCSPRSKTHHFRGFLRPVRRTARANRVGVALTDGWARPRGLFRGMRSHPARSRQDPSGTAPRLGRCSSRSETSHFLLGISPSGAPHCSRKLGGRGPHERLGAPPGRFREI